MSSSRLLPPEKIEAIFEMAARGEKQVHIARKLGISRGAVQDWLFKGQSSLETPAPRAFDVAEMPSADLPLNELLDQIEKQSLREREAAEAAKLVPVQIKTPGPIGLMIWGDPHLGRGNGCYFALLRSHVAIASAPHRRNYLFSGNIGDLHNNWIGRLSRLYGSQESSAKTDWRLVEWLMRDAGIQWLFLVRGNHDHWSGAGDPLNWIMRGADCADMAHGMRLALQHPNGVETRIHARHDFKGHSQFNDLHGLTKEQLFGFRDHLAVAGHRHIGGDGCYVTPGLVTQLVRVSGYKKIDDYAKQGGYIEKPIHPSALVVIDPSKPEDSRMRAWCAPSVEEGADYLDWLRARFDGGKLRVSVKAVTT